MVTFGETAKESTLLRPAPQGTDTDHPIGELSASSKMAGQSDAFNYREFKAAGETSTRSLHLNGRPIISPETSSKALTSVAAGPHSPANGMQASTPQDERPRSTKGEIVIHDDPYTVQGAHPLRKRTDIAMSRTTGTDQNSAAMAGQDAGELAGLVVDLSRQVSSLRTMLATEIEGKKRWEMHAEGV